MRKYILAFLLIVCAAVTTMAQDSYNEKVEKLIWSGHTKEFSKEYIEKAEDEIARLLVRKDSISEEEAKKKAHDFFENDYVPSITEISCKHISENLTEEQIDELLAGYEKPEYKIVCEHLKEAFSAMQDSSFIKSIVSIVPQIIQGEIMELPLDGVSEEYIAKFNQATSFYDLAKPLKQTMQTVFSAFNLNETITDEKAQAEFNNVINFLTNNIGRMGILAMYGHITETDLDWIIGFYSKPSGQAYAKAMEAVADEAMSLSTKKLLDFIGPNRMTRRQE